MELFTLGADRGAYTENDVREMARALTGWRADWTTAPARQLPLRPQPPGQRRRRRSSARPATTTGRTRAAVHRSTRCTRRSSSRKLWSYFIPSAAVGRRRGPRSRQSTSTRATRSARASRRSCMHPSLYEGPRDGQAAGRASTPACCARSRDRSIDTDWSGSRGRRPAPLLPARRRRLGRRALARHDARSRGRWDMVRYALDDVLRALGRPRHLLGHRDPRAGGRPAFASWANPS